MVVYAAPCASYYLDNARSQVPVSFGPPHRPRTHFGRHHHHHHHHDPRVDALEGGCVAVELWEEQHRSHVGHTVHTCMSYDYDWT